MIDNPWVVMALAFVLPAVVGALAVFAGRRPSPGGRHAITRDERRWFRVQAGHAGAFGNADASRIATLRVFDVDLLERRPDVRGGAR